MAVPPSGRRLTAHASARRQLLACALVLAHVPVLLALVLLEPTALWIGTTVALMVMEAALLRALSLAAERAREGEELLQNALWAGHASVRRRLEETEQIRSDLIGTVSHEFRTPLTGIRGAALTLLKRGDRLDTTARKQLLQAILEQQERLSRLLENMLTASRATAPDPAATAEVDAVAIEVAMLARSAHPQCPNVSVLVDSGTLAAIDRHALHQVLANLVDNAQQYGTPGSVPLIAGGTDADGVWLTVSNEGAPFDEATRLFEPFGQGDHGPTRAHEGIGMGLYVVRRLVEVHGGRVTASADGGWVTVEVRLPVAEHRRVVVAPQAGPVDRVDQVPTALPIA